MEAVLVVWVDVWPDVLAEEGGAFEEENAEDEEVEKENEWDEEVVDIWSPGKKLIISLSGLTTCQHRTTWIPSRIILQSLSNYNVADLKIFIS